MHCDTYRRFLDEKLGFDTVACVGEDWRRYRGPPRGDVENCIDMDGFPQPFFSNNISKDKFEKVECEVDWLSKSDWTKRMSSSGLEYYANYKEKITQFERPSDYDSSDDVIPPVDGKQKKPYKIPRKKSSKKS